MSSSIRIRLSFDKDHQEEHDDGGVAVATAKPKLSPPPMYKVILLNDDFTPMDFVVEVLQNFFNMNTEQATQIMMAVHIQNFFSMNTEQATQIMMAVHTQGKAVCGVYTRDVAETRSEQVNRYSREHQHPLLCKVEQDS